MSRRDFIVLALLVLVAGAAAAQTAMDVSFEAPTQVWGDTTGRNLTWVALVFSEDDYASGVLEASQGAHMENHSTLRRLMKTDTGVFDVSHSSDNQLPVESMTWPGPRADLSTRPGRWSSILVKAPQITVEVEGGFGSLHIGRDDRDLSDHLPSEVPAWTLRPQHLVPDRHVVLAHAESSAFRLHVTDTFVVEWHELMVTCHAECMDGAHTTVVGSEGSFGEARTESRPYTRLRLEGADLEVRGGLHALVAGGSVVDLNVTRVRLPLATGEAACEDCIALEQETLHANGSLHLRGLRADGEQFRAGLAGEPAGLRIDEVGIDAPRFLGSRAVEATVAAGLLATALAVLWKFKLASLFVRVTRDNALNNETRRRIYEVIVASPGCTAHALAEELECGRATVRHHLRKLCDVGLVVGKRVGGWSRFYENHGRYAQAWSQVHGLQDRHIRVLHSVLEREEAMARSAILYLVKDRFGWPYSTARYRLQRLEEAGLARRTTRDGRIWYEACSAPRNPTPP